MACTGWRRRGATGFVASAVVPDLLAAGHRVVGLARSDEAAATLIAAGAEAHRGDLQDGDSLRHGAEQADAVIHAASDHLLEHARRPSFRLWAEGAPFEHDFRLHRW